MNKTRILLFFVVFALSGCKFFKRLTSGSSAKDDFMFGAIYDSVHGSAVNEDYIVMMDVTDDQLIAFNGGIPGQDQDQIALSLDASAAVETPYMKSCKEAGVPIPPAWNSGKWKSVGTLPKDRIFALDARLFTEVYVYEDANGSCAALPRSLSGTIVALGMICQGNKGGACFWDNVDPITKAKIRDPDKIAPALVMDGSNLRENCTGCHRGDNVFIVHLGTVLENIPNRDPESRYQPIAAQAAWENTEGPTGNATAQKCQTCHGLPKFTRPYCAVVIKGSVFGTTGTPTMPPDSEDRKEYRWDISDVSKMCQDFFPKMPVPTSDPKNQPLPSDTATPAPKTL